MSDELPPIARHEAADRFGKAALRTAADLTAAVTDDEDAVPDPVVVRTDGPHRSLEGLAALLDEALAEDDAER
ncbi:hypothetical protein ACI784_15110 [Geodermatophilus sp. SYSU D01186]